MIIGNRRITKDGEPYFIADIASNHDGNIERAFKLIELAKEAGADAAKFQNFKADWIVSKNGFESMKKMTHQSAWKKSVYETYKDASISDEWTYRLKEKCDEVGIEYMTSPYDFAAVDLAEKYVNAYKIGSGDITWTDIIEYMAKKNKPLLLATGASDLSDVDRAVQVIEKYADEYVLMQCNTNYTANEENFKYVNLNVLNLYKDRYPKSILGLSDHTPGNVTVLGAMALGARVFEKHFTDDNDRIGPDHKFSMNPKTWKEMVQAANELYLALGDGIKRIEENEKESVIVQQRAFYFTHDIKAGQKLEEQDVFPLRPLKENCVHPYEIENIIGKVLLNDVKKDECLTWEMIKR